MTMPSDPPTPTPATPPPATPPPDAPTPDTAVVSQAKVDEIAAAARNQGSSAATKAALEALGVESVEEAAAIIKAAKDAELAAMSEAEQAKAKAEADQAAAAKLIADAAATKLDFELRSALLVGTEELPGCDQQYLDQAVTLGLGIAAADPENGVTAAVKHLRETVPVFFGASSETTTGGVPPAAGRPPGERGKPSPKTAEQEAMEMIARHRGEPVKQEETST